MKIILTVLILVTSLFNSIYCQDLEKVDELVRSYHYFETPEKLAVQISQDFSTDLEKARAIYAWVAMNVAYDFQSKSFTYSYRKKKEIKVKEEKRRKRSAAYTFTEKRAVCDGYANLYYYLCGLTGLECVVITGHSKTEARNIGRNSTKPDHAWNAVKIGKEWLPIDATWGAGTVDGRTFTANYNDTYFNTSAEKFNLSHYADEAKLRFSRISKRKFQKSPLFYTEYIASDFTVASPKKGIIKVKPQKEITIKILANRHPKDMLYNFSRDEYGHDLNFKKAGKYYEAKITVPKRKSSTLTLYYQQEAIVEYKLKY